MKICVTRDSVGAADDVNYHVLAAAYAELATALVVGGLTPVRLLRRDGVTSSERWRSSVLRVYVVFRERPKR